MRNRVFWIVLIVLSFCFSSWLMWHTFSYDPEQKTLVVSDKIWSDFGNHLPLVRSFSFGQNWPPQNPLFPGEKIRYHFLFFAGVGLLEKIGFRLDWALNTLSVAGFASLMVSIGLLAYRLFSSKKVAVLSVLFFLFNGSLSFLKYFEKNGLSVEAIKGIVINSRFPSFGPWDGTSIAAIWNLNIYTNQRHLAPSIAIALIVIYVLNFRKIHPFLLAFLFGVLMFLNQAIFAGLMIFVAIHFLIHASSRIRLIQTALLTLPWLLISGSIVNLSSQIHYKPGFLFSGNIFSSEIISYWIDNLGLHLLLIPIGFFLAPKNTKLLAVPLLILFLVPNMFQLSTDMFNNHKLFNMFIVVGGMYSANALVQISKRKILVPIALALFVFATLSGVIDFFAVKNDAKLRLKAGEENPDISFVLRNTNTTDVVLNSTWFYHPASLAGRSIYNGYTYFTWSHGYDSYGREDIQKAIYRSPGKTEACQLLLAENIKWVEFNDHPEDFLKPNFGLWTSTFSSDYYNSISGIRFINVEKNCNAT